jgi:hypothetical protein
MFKPSIALAVIALGGTLQAQSPAISATMPSPSPAQLPGNSLAQHDFLYAGESRDRKIFIARQGKIVWSYNDPPAGARSAMASCSPMATSSSPTSSA